MAPASEINLMYDREEERPGIPSLRTVMPTPSRCQECCEIAVTKRVEFWRLIGAVILFHFASKGGWLCKSCIHKCFWDYTLITAVLADAHSILRQAGILGTEQYRDTSASDNYDLTARNLRFQILHISFGGHRVTGERTRSGSAKVDPILRELFGEIHQICRNYFPLPTLQRR
jgi:hypothetical protein